MRSFCELSEHASASAASVLQLRQRRATANEVSVYQRAQRACISGTKWSVQQPRQRRATATPQAIPFTTFYDCYNNKCSLMGSIPHQSHG